MNASQTSFDARQGVASSDPTLQRLHEVTDRIRQRAAEARAREEARAARRARGYQSELPLRLAPLPPRRAAPVPRHWSEGAGDEQSAA